MTKLPHLEISFNIALDPHASFQKHLGIYLHEKFSCNHNIEGKNTKAIKAIGVIKRLSRMLLQNSLFMIYKSSWLW